MGPYLPKVLKKSKSLSDIRNVSHMERPYTQICSAPLKFPEKQEWTDAVTSDIPARRHLKEDRMSPQEYINHSLIPDEYVSTFTMFVAGFPVGMYRSFELQWSLEAFFLRWASIKSVKLVCDPSTGYVKYAFAEFFSESDAMAAAQGSKRYPFYSSYLRLEPARGERTVRFSLYNPTTPLVKFNSARLWLLNQEYQFTCEFVMELSSLFGSVEKIKEYNDYYLTMDVVFKNRRDAIQAYLEIGQMMDISNLLVSQVAMKDGTQALSSQNRFISEDRQFIYIHQKLPFLNYEGLVQTPLEIDTGRGECEMDLWDDDLSDSRKMSDTSAHEAIIVAKSNVHHIPHWARTAKISYSISPTAQNMVNVSGLGSYVLPSMLWNLFQRFGPVESISSWAVGKATIIFLSQRSAAYAWKSLTSLQHQTVECNLA